MMVGAINVSGMTAKMPDDFAKLEAARQVINAARDLLDQIKVAKGANSVLITSAQSMLVSAVSIMTGEYEVQP